MAIKYTSLGEAARMLEGEDVPQFRIREAIDLLVQAVQAGELPATGMAHHVGTLYLPVDPELWKIPTKKLSEWCQDNGHIAAKKVERGDVAKMRRMQILALKNSGMTNAQIAKQENISESRVRVLIAEANKDRKKSASESLTLRGQASATSRAGKKR